MVSKADVIDSNDYNQEAGRMLVYFSSFVREVCSRDIVGYQRLLISCPPCG
jgi:hypothetical protein